MGRKVPPEQVTPGQWQRGSGHLVVSRRGGIWTQGQGVLTLETKRVHKQIGVERENVSQHLSFLHFEKAYGDQSKVRTGLGRSDCPGSQGGSGKPSLWRN